MKRRDVNETAFAIVQQAIGETPKGSIKQSAKAAELGRTGGLKGGAARAIALTPERRSEIARNAARARWGDKKG